MDKCLCSKEDMGVLIGTLCGDCGRKEKRLYCGQSVKQKDWFEYKKARFEKIFNRKGIYNRKRGFSGWGRESV